MEGFSGLRTTVTVSLVLLCCSTVCCATGIYALADQGRTVHLGPTTGIPMVALGLLVWTVPPLLWQKVSAEGGEGWDEG